MVSSGKCQLFSKNASFLASQREQSMFRSIRSVLEHVLFKSCRQRALASSNLSIQLTS